MGHADELVLAQVAYICDRVGGATTGAWYQRVLGFLPAGSTDKFGGADLAELQGLDEDVKVTITWLVERNDRFQLELFDYERPASRPRPAGWTPRDIGYVATTLFVRDFDAVVARARQEGALHDEPEGADGRRRAVLADPNGILLEILEQDVTIPGAAPIARPDVALGVRAITASVPDLDRSLAFFRDAFELAEVDAGLRADHAPVGAGAGGTYRTATLAAGDVLLELVEHRDPSGAPRPDGHRLSDGGVMNIALATTDRALYERLRARVTATGADVREFVPDDAVAVAYVTDEQGFNVELLYMAPAAYAAFGFLPDTAAATAEAR